jgi:hypothetical protein
MSQNSSIDADMSIRKVLACLWLLGSGIISAQSQTTKHEPAFFIIFNSLTKKCTIVEKMPHTDTPNISLASDAIYNPARKLKAQNL